MALSPEDEAYQCFLDYVRHECHGEGEACKVRGEAERERCATEAVMHRCSLRWGCVKDPSTAENHTLFDGPKATTVPIRKYSQHLIRHLNPSPVALLAGDVYLSRITSCGSKPVVLSATNIHRLLLTSVMQGAKFFDDE